MIRAWMLVVLAVAVAAAPALAAVEAPAGGAIQKEQAGAGERVGSIQAIDLKGTPPTLKVSGSGGQSWTLALDLRRTSVTQNGKAAKVEQLRVGQPVTVMTAMEGGREFAKSIQIGEEKKGPGA